MAVVGLEDSEVSSEDSMLADCFAAPKRAPGARGVRMVASGPFYASYHGHQARFLEDLLDGLLHIHGDAPVILVSSKSLSPMC